MKKMKEERATVGVYVGIQSCEYQAVLMKGNSAEGFSATATAVRKSRRARAIRMAPPGGLRGMGESLCRAGVPPSFAPQGSRSRGAC